MSANDMLELVPENTKSVGEALARLCPLLLLQLHSSACDSAGASSNPSLRPSSAAGKENYITFENAKFKPLVYNFQCSNSFRNL